MLLLGYGIEVALVAQLGAVPVAANRLIENVTLISFTALVASGTGVTVLVGQRLGAGDLEGAAAYRAVGLRLSALLAGVPLIPVLLAPGLVFVAVSWWRYHAGAWRTSTV
jgi:multidrug resistance protein, MATE family